VIRIKAIHIQEFRGIRELNLDLGAENFGICGPNGTGKSGVVDAIEFCLTGNITRLSGHGQGDLNVKGHAPHVDKRSEPDKSFVSISATIPSLKKDVKISRSVKYPNIVGIVPNDPAVEAVINELQFHPEFALSRRDIAKYIVTPPAERYTDVQNLLRLEHIGSLRKAFVSYANRCLRDEEEAQRARTVAESELKTALGISKLDREQVLTIANAQREILDLSPLAELTPHTSFKEGASSGGAGKKKPAIIKAVAITDLKALFAAIEAGESSSKQTLRKRACAALRNLHEDATALSIARAHGFITTGLDLVAEDACPLCDKPWDAEDLRAHLRSKLLRAAEIGDQLKGLGQSLGAIIGDLDERAAAIRQAAEYGALLAPAVGHLEIDEYANALDDAKAKLTAFQTDYSQIEGAILALESKWWFVPTGAQERLEQTAAGLNSLPEASAKEKAIDFLAVVQDRYERLLSTTKITSQRKSIRATAEKLRDHYNSVSNKVLEDIYDAVGKDFTLFYRSINDDEGKFIGELRADPAKLSFNVDFYGRGTFPPGAYHSEGHQDGMGLCLYLALMKYTLGDKFTFAVLDDVLMSVDTGHRREVCRLLKTQFPNTQFVLTTHDRVWLQYMRTESLISKAQLFGGWTVENGPRIWDDKDIWTEIENALSLDSVPGAAALLRRYLEYICAVLADNLRAPVEYRGDASYDLGDLLPAVLARWKDRLRKGVKSAEYWGHNEAKVKVISMLEEADKIALQIGAEQWAINKSVHFTQWENFTGTEFKAVSGAFKAFLDHVRCQNPKCRGYPYLMPRKGSAEQLRCNCLTVNVNLKAK
jgi:hypothetical protein